jgi:hypothetical protein
MSENRRVLEKVKTIKGKIVEQKCNRQRQKASFYQSCSQRSCGFSRSTGCSGYQFNNRKDDASSVGRGKQTWKTGKKTETGSEVFRVGRFEDRSFSGFELPLKSISVLAEIRCQRRS